MPPRGFQIEEGKVAKIEKTQRKVREGKVKGKGKGRKKGRKGGREGRRGGKEARKRVVRIAHVYVVHKIFCLKAWL